MFTASPTTGHAAQEPAGNFGFTRLAPFQDCAVDPWALVSARAQHAPAGGGVRTSDLYPVLQGLLADAAALGRAQAALVRDVSEHWELGQKGCRRHDDPCGGAVSTDGCAILVGRGCVLTRTAPAPPALPTDALESRRPAVLVSPKAWRRESARWMVRGELVQLLRDWEVSFAPARGPVPLLPQATAADLQRTFDAAAWVAHLARTGRYQTIAAELVEHW